MSRGNWPSKPTVNNRPTRADQNKPGGTISRDRSSTSTVSGAIAAALGLTNQQAEQEAAQAAEAAAAAAAAAAEEAAAAQAAEEAAAAQAAEEAAAAAAAAQAQANADAAAIEASLYDEDTRALLEAGAKIVNVPLRKITDNGPVKVLGTGFNTASIKWNGGIHNVGSSSNSIPYLDIENWDRWNDFPTLVQVGDLVWAWRDTYRNNHNGADYRYSYTSRWQLVEIRLSEPAKNIAYPAPANQTLVGIDLSYQVGENPAQTPELEYSPAPVHYENVTSVTANSDSNDSGDWLKGFHTDRVITYVIPAFEGGDITHYKIGGVSGSGSYINGMGGESYLKFKDGSLSQSQVAMFFPPIRYKWQFEELYGKEEDWVAPQQTKIWDEPDYASGIAPYYTYEFPEPPESSFRYIPGDNTANGIDD